jgi:hypothetical protein
MEDIYCSPLRRGGAGLVDQADGRLRRRPVLPIHAWAGSFGHGRRLKDGIRDPIIETCCGLHDFVYSTGRGSIPPGKY